VSARRIDAGNGVTIGAIRGVVQDLPLEAVKPTRPAVRSSRCSTRSRPALASS
jgi:hypothetical protein